MAYQTCIDCTVFLENQGMDGHPVFETREAWLEHRHHSHGAPKPPEKPEPEPEPKPEPVPEPEPEEPRPAYEENAELWRAMRALQERIEALEAKETNLIERLPIEPVAEG